MMHVDLTTDHHVHTHLCNHAAGELEEYVLAAIDKKLNTLIFLEHLETDISYFERTWLTEKDFEYFFKEGSRLKKKYAGRITIKLGAEVGFNPRAVEKIYSSISTYPFEYTGLSYHYYNNGTQHLNMVSRRPENMTALSTIGTDKVISEYLEGLIQGVQLLDCNLLCHLDAAMRHQPGIRFEQSHWKQIDQLLALVRAKEMSLEVNTSGYPLRNEPYPSLPFLQKAVDLGIHLAAGSDAHRPDQVGRHFDRLPELFSLIRKPVYTDPSDNIKPAT